MRKTLIFLLAALPGLLTGPRASEAAIRVWTGAGGNAQWSTPGNWIANIVPTSGDAVVIPSHVAATLGVNNLVGLTLSGIVIQHAYTLTGNEILLGANGLHVVNLPGNNAVVLAAPFRLTANQTWVIHDEITAINSSIALNSRSLTLEVTQTGLLHLAGVISGTGAIVKTGVGEARVSGNNSYAGPTTINEGYLRVHSDTGLGLGDGTAANGTVVNGSITDVGMNGSLHIVSAAIGNEAITVQGTGQSNNGALAAVGTASIAGPLTVASDIGINVIKPAQLTFNGPIGGPGRLVLVHNGTFIFGNGNNTYTGGLGIGEGGDHHSRVIIADDEGIPFAPLQNVPATASLTLDPLVTQTLAGLTGGGSLLLASSASHVAEGATGPFFETFVLIANPNPSPVDVTLTFGRQREPLIQMSRSIPASSRLTLNLETLDPGLANTPVSTRVDASLPVIVERAQYWPDPAPQWHESHGGVALQALSTKWGFAEGRVGGPAAYQTYILLANTTAEDAQVSITFLRESGVPFTKTFTVAATERLNVPVGPGTDVPELVDERFGALITSDQPIAVERAMYANAGEQVWAAGTSANGTPLPE